MFSAYSVLRASLSVSALITSVQSPSKRLDLSLEDGIDKARRKGLTRHRISMSTAPLVCQICKKSKSQHSGMIADLIRPSLLEFIKKKLPEIDPKGFICFQDLGEFRKDYLKDVLEEEIGELSALDQEVVESLEQH